MKRLMTLFLAAGLVVGAATGASAIDFNAKGQWLFGFGVTDSTFISKMNGHHTNAADKFQAVQRLRLQMQAVASENLSGTVGFEIGDTVWGYNDDGGALGADQKIVKVKSAYIDWVVPNTDLSLRMGIQGVTLPNVAGGSAILDDDAAAIVASYKINDMLSVTGGWVRPLNDNWAGNKYNDTYYHAGYQDNIDLGFLAVPVTGDGFTVTPWVAYGYAGKNITRQDDGTWGNGHLPAGITPITFSEKQNSNFHRGSNIFFAGLPFTISMFDPFEFSVDVNYGYVEGFGRYGVTDQKSGIDRRANSRREGWLIKGLAEYKLDWGIPGIFAWYGSGDDSNLKNGSERMPYISPCGNFTSFMGDGPEYGWGPHNGDGSNAAYDLMLNYSGTWGVGLQLRDMTFLEDLKHTFRVAYWGGTNNTNAVKYLGNNAINRAVSESFENTGTDGVYLTTADYLLEFNLVNVYKIYENLEMALELGYIVNGLDKDTWNRSFNHVYGLSTADAYKANLLFQYSF